MAVLDGGREGPCCHHVLQAAADPQQGWGLPLELKAKAGCWLPGAVMAHRLFAVLIGVAGEKGREVGEVPRRECQGQHHPA